MEDVLLDKVTKIERCIKRINEVHRGSASNLKDLTNQESIIMNIQRALEACIDLAMHVISERKLGIPSARKEAFEILRKTNVIERELAQSLIDMVGFCHIAVWDYQVLDPDILHGILEKQLDDFRHFAQIVLRFE